MNSIMSLQSNTSALTAQNAIARAQDRAAALVTQLSSGSSAASVDGATLAISSQLSAEQQSMAQANSNAMDAASMLQTADGGLQEIGGLLAQMQGLAIQGANGGTLSASDRQAIDTQYQQLSSEVDQIARTSNYNGASLLSGGGSTFQIGPDDGASDRLSVSLPDVTTQSLGIAGSGLGSVGTAMQALDGIGAAINQVAVARDRIGTSQNIVGSAVDNLSVQSTQAAATNSRLIDTDYASALSGMAQNQILQDASVAVDAQANQLPDRALALL